MTETRETEAWRPRIFDRAAPEDDVAFRKLVAADPSLVVIDEIADQLEDLAGALEPRPACGPQRAEIVRAEVGGRSLDAYGRWVHYPWRGHVVHVLPPERFWQVRTDRNRFKITDAEQRRLRAATVAVAGLSVGKASALTLAMEGVGGRFRLADFDRLSLSNLNRLAAGVHEIGLRKTTIAARQIAELDPFAQVEIYPDGITADIVEEFLDGADVLVEECDSLEAKVLLREAARRAGIPVVMETSDRGMLDIERFDLEPERPLLHGLMDVPDPAVTRGLRLKQKAPWLLPMVDHLRISPAFGASLVEMEETVHTWPQLASSIALGGALATDATRKILLGRLRTSGRWYVDLDELVVDGTDVPVRLPPEPPAVEVAQEAACGRTAPVLADADPASLGRYLAACATLAPSGGNVQPWELTWDGQAMEVRRDPVRSSLLFDPDGLGADLTIGAAVENIVLAAEALGLSTTVDICAVGTDIDLVCRVGVRGTPGAESLPASPPPELVRRVTNRRIPDYRPLTPHQVEALTAAMGDAASIRVVTARPAIAGVGDLVATAERWRCLDHGLHAELMREMRWTPEHVLATRDGLDLAALELPPMDAAGMRVSARWDVMERVADLGGGRALESQTHRLFAETSAVVLILASSDDRAGFFDAGRATQRLWLEATRQNLAVQPMTTLPYVFRLLRDGGATALSPRAAQGYRDLVDAWKSRLSLSAEDAPAMLLRVGHAPPPTALSLRRELDDVFRGAA